MRKEHNIQQKIDAINIAVSVILLAAYQGISIVIIVPPLFVSIKPGRIYLVSLNKGDAVLQTKIVVQ